MYLAPLNYDRYFKKIFSDPQISQTFLEDFLDVKIESLETLPKQYQVSDEKEALKDRGFCDIFGCPKEDSAYKEARQGRVMFFDAFPANLTADSIQPDSMNPHYGPYYAEGKPPADYHNPVPVNFLTVQNTTFEFYVGAKPRKNQEIGKGRFIDKTPLDVVQEELPNTLSMHGIGAKTAVGYGYFLST